MFWAYCPECPLEDLRVFNACPLADKPRTPIVLGRLETEVGRSPASGSERRATLSRRFQCENVLGPEAAKNAKKREGWKWYGSAYWPKAKEVLLGRDSRSPADRWSRSTAAERLELPGTLRSSATLVVRSPWQSITRLTWQPDKLPFLCQLKLSLWRPLWPKFAL